MTCLSTNDEELLLWFLSNLVNHVSPADAVTLHLSSMPSQYLSPSTEDRIRQVSIITIDACAHVLQRNRAEKVALHKCVCTCSLNSPSGSSSVLSKLQYYNLWHILYLIMNTGGGWVYMCMLYTVCMHHLHSLWYHLCQKAKERAYRYIKYIFVAFVFATFSVLYLFFKRREFSCNWFPNSYYILLLHSTWFNLGTLHSPVFSQIFTDTSTTWPPTTKQQSSSWEYWHLDDDVAEMWAFVMWAVNMQDVVLSYRTRRHSCEHC